MSDVCDLELENAVIAALLRRPELLDDIDPILAPADFSEPRLGKVFEAMRLTAAEAGTFTPLVLKKHLPDTVGGLQPVEYLEALMTQPSEPSRGFAIPLLAAQIIDYSRRRALISLCTQLSDAAKGADAPSYTELLESVEDSLYLIPTTGEQFSVKTAGDGCDESLAAARRYMDGVGPRGVRANLKAWNSLVGPMLPGDLVVVGGTTSAGKTALVQQVAYEVAQSLPVLAFSLEMTLAQWSNRYLAQHTSIPAERIETGELSQDEYKQLRDVSDDIKRLRMVVTDRPCLSVSQMRSFAKRVRRRLGALSLIVVDHLQFITPPDRLEGPAAIAAITRELKAAAKDLSVPIILVSHLNRDISHRDNKRPILSDLFGSSAIEKDADAVVFLHRDVYWISRQGPKLPDDPEDDAARAALYKQWQQTMEHIKRDADLILAKRRRGKGDGFVTVDFDSGTTKFFDRIPRAFPL